MAKRRAAMYQEAIDAVVAAASTNASAAQPPTTNVSTSSTSNNVAATPSSSSPGQLYAPLTLFSTPLQQALTPQFTPATPSSSSIFNSFWGVSNNTNASSTNTSTSTMNHGSSPPPQLAFGPSNNSSTTNYTYATPSYQPPANFNPTTPSSYSSTNNNGLNFYNYYSQQNLQASTVSALTTTPAPASSAPSTFTSSSTNSYYTRLNGHPYSFTYVTNTNNVGAPATAAATSALAAAPPAPTVPPPPLTNTYNRVRKLPKPRAPPSTTTAAVRGGRGRGGRIAARASSLPLRPPLPASPWTSTAPVNYNPPLPVHTQTTQIPAPLNLSTLDPKYYVGSGPSPIAQQNSANGVALIPKGEPYLITASPPTPPDWATSLQASIQSLASPYHRTPVAPDSIEHQVLSDLILPSVPGLKLNSIDRVVNPSLWSKFIAMRKEMLCSKTDDLALLASFGLSGDEIQQRAHIALNYTKDPSVFGSTNQYSDNMVLLFHCTKTGNLDSILSQGLDERVGSGGLLGRGIYFADNPAKSICYDANNTLLVFAVLLGDCLCVDSLATKGSLVREPEKTPAQRRNHLDLFFDSIVGRPAGYNEYVIYNRAQCVPLYSVGYTKQSISGRPMDYYSTSRSCIPIFAWSTNINVVQEYYQYAQHLFRLMWSNVVQEDDHQGIDAANAVGAGSKEKDTEVGVDNGAGQLEKHLNYLFDIGFMDIDLNTSLLEANGYNLQVTIDQLLDTSTTTAAGDNDGNQGASFGNMASTSKSTATSSTSNQHGNGGNGINFDDVIDLTADDSFIDMDQSNNHETASASTIANGAASAPATKPEPPAKDDCAICFNDYDLDSATDWKILNCTHKICSSCYTQIQSSGTTMSGAIHTYIKCPFCGSCTGGAEIGSCPNGSMTHIISPSQTCAGYESSSAGVITINYDVPPRASDGLAGLNRSAYLPNNPEGQHVLGLLQVAWDRRLIFSIGTSMTTGANNVLVWNIHHKTATSGGVGSHGYPDPSYLSRVQLELAQYGIQ